MEEANQKPDVNPEDRRAYWQRQIFLVQESNLTVAQYCRDNNISKASFYYWRQALQGKKAKTKARAKDFIRVNVSEACAEGTRLALGRGVFLHFDQEPRATWICAVVCGLSQEPS